jgi:hypothetical protein
MIGGDTGNRSGYLVNDRCRQTVIGAEQELSGRERQRWPTTTPRGAAIDGDASEGELQMARSSANIGSG